MVLQNEYLNSLCQVQSPTNQMLCVGKIISIGENYVILGRTTEGLPPLRFLSFVKMTLKHPRAGYKVLLASVTESTEDTLRLSSMITLTADERRGYFRVRTDMPTKIYLCENPQAILDREEDLIQSRMRKQEPKSKPIPEMNATIRDLSLGGLLLECSDFLRLGQRVVVEIEMKRGVEYFLISIKRRLDDDERSRLKTLLPSDSDNSLWNSKLYQYGCMFHEKSNIKMDELCRMILEMQAALIQKMKK